MASRRYWISFGGAGNADKLREAIKKADFTSLRGKFPFGLPKPGLTLGEFLLEQGTLLVQQFAHLCRAGRGADHTVKVNEANPADKHIGIATVRIAGLLLRLCSGPTNR